MYDVLLYVSILLSYYLLLLLGNLNTGRIYFILFIYIFIING